MECPNKDKSFHAEKLALTASGECRDCGHKVQPVRVLRHHRSNGRSILRTTYEYEGEFFSNIGASAS